ncbi:glycoside hydrolase family 76 protein [Xylariaceae sp. FL0804]|nr:glycoside hydrolase family 76 protein [Xylariaceae sp. FL0804]
MGFYSRQSMPYPRRPWASLCRLLAWSAMIFGISAASSNSHNRLANVGGSSSSSSSRRATTATTTTTTNSSGVTITMDMTHAAIEAMMQFYNESTGIWGANPWWQSGVALRAITEYMLATGSNEYLAAAENTVNIQRAPLAWWPSGGGDFRADSTDDTGWWALALTSLYRLTGNATYLALAREDEAYMYAYWNATTCGGGLIWDIPTRSYHNAISNELYLELAATLHNLLGPSGDGDGLYLARAREEWAWFEASGMIDAQTGLVNDGLTQDAACVNNNQTVWSYNQGVLLSGLAQLWAATGNATLLAVAASVADAAVAPGSPLTSAEDGILTETGCDTEVACEPNSVAFKGIFIRGLAALDRALLQLQESGNSTTTNSTTNATTVAATRTTRYGEYIARNAQSAYARDRNASDFYGLLWQGPDDNSTIGTQESAVYLLLEAASL